VRQVALAIVVASSAVAIAQPPPAHGELAFVPATPPPPKFPPPPPGPPPQVATLSKQLVGTWTCKGTYRDERGEARRIEGTTTIALELDGAWLKISSTTVVGGARTKAVELRSFDVVAKQWTRVVLASDARHAVQTSLGAIDGTWTWVGDGATDSQRLGTNEITTWRQVGGEKTYEATCRR
jgi:hypothetical protein